MDLYEHQLQTAAADFRAGVDLANEAMDKLKDLISLWPSERRGLTEMLGTDVVIAIAVFRMMRIATSFPAPYAAALIMQEMSHAFKGLIFVNFIANKDKWNCCPIHGPRCELENEEVVFPEHVDDDLKPVTEVEQ
jgi:hypothetical protein